MAMDADEGGGWMMQKSVDVTLGRGEGGFHDRSWTSRCQSILCLIFHAPGDICEVKHTRSLDGGENEEVKPL
jgi:hypothetical protein